MRPHARYGRSQSLETEVVRHLARSHSGPRQPNPSRWTTNTPSEPTILSNGPSTADTGTPVPSRNLDLLGSCRYPRTGPTEVSFPSRLAGVLSCPQPISAAATIRPRSTERISPVPSSKHNDRISVAVIVTHISPRYCSAGGRRVEGVVAGR